MNRRHILKLLGSVFGGAALGTAPQLLDTPPAIPKVLEVAPPVQAEAIIPEPVVSAPEQRKVTETDLLKGTLFVALDRYTGRSFVAKPVFDKKFRRTMMRSVDIAEMNLLIVPASLTKLLITTAALELIQQGALKPDQKVSFSLYAQTVGGHTLQASLIKQFKAKKGITTGAPIKTSDLPEAFRLPKVVPLHQMLEWSNQHSYNDAARAVAEVVAKRLGLPLTPDGMKEMLDKLAKRYGLDHTTLKDPSGMPGRDLNAEKVTPKQVLKRDLEEGAFASPADMMLLAVQAVKQAARTQFIQETRTKRKSFVKLIAAWNEVFKPKEWPTLFLRTATAKQAGIEKGDLPGDRLKTGTANGNNHEIAASDNKRFVFGVFGAEDYTTRDLAMSLGVPAGLVALKTSPDLPDFPAPLAILRDPPSVSEQIHPQLRR